MEEQKKSGPSFRERLNQAVQAMSVQKKNNNGFLNYKYRNIEDIYEQLVPVLNKFGIGYRESMAIRTGDKLDILHIDSVVYDTTGDEEFAYTYDQPIFYAVKDKQDPVQSYGAALSYARRYNLSAIFMVRCGIKDLDSEELTKQRVDSATERDEVMTALRNAKCLKDVTDKRDRANKFKFDKELHALYIERYNYFKEQETRYGKSTI